MKSKLNTAALILALGLPFAVAHAQTTAAPDPHHPDSPAAATPPAAGLPAAPSAATPSAAGSGSASPQMGMMMGEMRQMMGMMQQMMQMMGGGVRPTVGSGTGASPMMGMMQGGPGGGSGMGMGMGPGGQRGPGQMAGQPGDAMMPGMFRHTDGILAFYKAELRITDAQTSQWNGFADAVRNGAKGMREGMQRMAAQRSATTVPEQLERRVAMLTSYLDAAKAVSTAAKPLYAVLTPEQRKLADEFMADHMRGMRRMAP